MFDIWELNFAIELWDVAFCAIGIACALLLVSEETQYRSLLLTMFSLELVAAAGDAATVIYKGNVDRFARIALHVGNFAVFACTFLLQAAVSQYLCLRFREVGGPSYRRWCLGVQVAAAIMCVLTACGVFYTFDAASMYHRNDGYWLSIAFVACASAVNAALVMANRCRLGGTSFACLLAYTVTPFVASGIQSLVYGPNLAIAAGVIGLVVVFLEMQVHLSRMVQRQTEELAQAREQAANDRIAVMVSQIQPHFLFNALDTIYGLVDDDRELAKETIVGFSNYLRTNLAPLNLTEPVPVERELEHVRTYLEIERASDPGRISYEFDVASTGFSVPALSVQTLAENAVKHGIGAKVEGGTVRVRTRELQGEYTVSVIDDGAGFDVTAGPAPGRPHIGLDNTRSRLAALCGGTLEVLSEPGAGTSAIMHVPKPRG